MLVKVGAAAWIARIMVTWGLISSAMLFVSGPASFYALRFLLGAAEAGFFPGVVYVLTLWFPREYRARTISLFMVAAVFSFVIGSPVSGWLLDHAAFSLRGWQWLFLVEGLPPLVLGALVYRWLPNGPRHARWLNDADREWLVQRLARDESIALNDVSKARAADPHAASSAPPTWKSLLREPRIWALCLVYFLNVVGGYGVDFFAPAMLRVALPDLTPTELGRVLILPPLVTIPVMLGFGWLCDTRKQHRHFVAFAALVFSAGLGTLAVSQGTIGTLLGLGLCSAARWSLIGPFWGLTTALLPSSAAAGGIALINAIGNLGGQAGPVILSTLASGGSYAKGLGVLSLLLLLGAVVTLAFRSHRGAT